MDFPLRAEYPQASCTHITCPYSGQFSPSPLYYWLGDLCPHRPGGNPVKAHDLCGRGMLLVRW